MLEVTDLQKSYVSNGQEVPVVKGVTFRIEPGNFYSLLGPSGLRQDHDAALCRRAGAE